MSCLDVSNIMSLTGQVALVTGGGTGIGLMIAKGFAANGAKVYITGRRQEVLQKAAASQSAKEGVLVPLVMDVTDQTSIDKAVKHIQATEGRLDILVNNAGANGPTSKTDPDFLQKKLNNHIGNKDPLEHETFQGWADMFDTNISAPFFVSTACVINVGSTAASVKSLVTVVSLGYPTSKSAVEKLSIGLATDFAHRSIPVRVNVLHPGTFPSEMVPPGDLRKIDRPIPGFLAPTPLKRAGTEEEMVMTVMYLAACGYANGASITVDGGVALVNP